MALLDLRFNQQTVLSGNVAKILTAIGVLNLKKS